jgi:Fe2+ transport system protein FeoA
MIQQTITLSGSSLSLLDLGERGRILKLQNLDRQIERKLQQMGLVAGASIELERRSPSFVVKKGNARLTLDRDLVRSIYVRLER